jgi:hypothetical protein
MKAGAQPRLDRAPQREPDVLAAIYRIAIQRYERVKAAGVTSTNGNDMREESESDSHATPNHSK